MDLAPPLLEMWFAVGIVCGVLSGLYGERGGGQGCWPSGRIIIAASRSSLGRFQTACSDEKSLLKKQKQDSKIGLKEEN